jgi:hypothetical protein
MNSNAAAAFINNVSFRPGWRFTADPVHWHGEAVYLTVTIKTVDSSSITASGTYARPVTLQPIDTALDVSDLDEDGILLRLLEIAHLIDEHEDREFIKVRRADDTWDAPFHPHTASGNARWNRVKPRRHSDALV